MRRALSPIRKCISRALAWLKIMRALTPVNLKSAINILVSFIVDTALCLFYNHNIVNVLGGTYFIKDSNLYFYTRPRTDDLYHIIPGREGIIERFILHFVPEEGYFIDVGANIGYYTCLISKAKTKTKIVSVEPIPGTFKVLNLNCCLNNVKVITVNKALWSRITRVNFGIPKLKKMYLYGLSHSESRDARLSSIEIPATTLDFILERYKFPRVDLVKIDTEGAEYKVLLGAKKSLEKIRYLYVECRKNLEESVKNYLRKYGFVCARWEVPHAVHLFCANRKLLANVK